MRKLEVRLQQDDTASRLVGTLAEQERRIYFEYDADFLRSGLELSPFHLPLRPGLLVHEDLAFGPLPGLFHDSLPDAWGLLLMDRWFRSKGVEPARLSPLDRLAWLGERTMGALTYHPAEGPEAVEHGALDLTKLARNADELIRGQADTVLPALAKAGGSPGGARPKVLIGYDPDSGELVSGDGNLPEGWEPWLVKFNAHMDGAAAGSIELAYAEMARACGLVLPATRLFETRDGQRLFAVRRFDRRQGKRVHVHTLAGLIQADFRVPSTDYGDFLKVTRALTRDQSQVLHGLRLAAFNLMAHNRDDHTKNISFLLDEQTGEWSLSPAYDLTFAEGPGGEHSMTFQGEGRAPTLPHLRTLGRNVGLHLGEIDEVLEEVAAGVARWPEFASAAAVPDSIRDGIGERILKQIAARP